MTLDTQSPAHPLSQLCSECGEERVNHAVIAYDAEVKYDGKLQRFHIPRLVVRRCDNCGEIYFDAVTHKAVTQALREHLHLLSPEQIREHLARLGFNQREFSEKIEIAEETVSRWLNGAKIQSRAYDKLMRLFFDQEESHLVRRAVSGVFMRDGMMSPWQCLMHYEMTPLITGMYDMGPGELSLAA